MPRVYRAMRSDGDGCPRIEATAAGLGVRVGVDVEVDAGGIVVLDGKGMSVSPDWRDLPLHRIPERLKAEVPDARGSNRSSCFRYGIGPFLRGAFADDLTLEPDSSSHGTVAPSRPMSLPEYQAALAMTRTGWVVDEG